MEFRLLYWAVVRGWQVFSTSWNDQAQSTAGPTKSWPNRPSPSFQKFRVKTPPVLKRNIEKSRCQEFPFRIQCDRLHIGTKTCSIIHQSYLYIHLFHLCHCALLQVHGTLARHIWCKPIKRIFPSDWAHPIFGCLSFGLYPVIFQPQYYPIPPYAPPGQEADAQHIIFFFHCGILFFIQELLATLIQQKGLQFPRTNWTTKYDVPASPGFISFTQLWAMEIWIPTSSPMSMGPQNLWSSCKLPQTLMVLHS